MHPHDGIAVCSFHGRSGETEHTITVEADAGPDLARQIDTLTGRYREAQQALKLAPESALFRRICLSDAANQASAVVHSRLCPGVADDPVAVSLVQQPPLGGEKIALLALHRAGSAPLVKHRLGRHHVLTRAGRLGHLWSGGLCAHNDDHPGTAAAQTDAAFDELTGVLGAHGATLADNCVRTWIYVKDVDIFYQDMVDARLRLFERHGLNRDTHYIASTGIGGACRHRHDLVAMDAYSILGLAPAQVSYLNDFERLCATKDYNVTFERGTRIAYADRAHHFISGTASIDAAGHVVHAGDVVRQLDRALENVEALLRSGGARIDDMAHFLVYLRDPADHGRIDAAFAERFPAVPRLVLHAPVCRPDWLVEVEGIAVAPHDGRGLPAF